MKKTVSLLLLIAILSSLAATFSSCALFADDGGASSESISESESTSGSEPTVEGTTFSVTLTEYTEAFSTLGDKARAYMNASDSTSIAKIVEAEAGYIPLDQSEWYQRDTKPFRAYRFDKPMPVSLSFAVEDIENDATFALAIVFVSENADMENAVPYTTDTTAIDIYNLKSDTDYYWRVTAVLSDGSAATSEIGSFVTADTPRLLYIDGLYNVRDIGGWEGLDGERIRQGLVYRGTQLDGLHNEPDFHLTEEGATALALLGIKTDLDMRGASNSVSPIEGATRKNFAPSSYGSAFGSGKYIYGQMLKEFADPDNYPMYVHCTYGADRTGTLFYILEALLGVSEEDLLREYELTGLVFGSVSREPILRPDLHKVLAGLNAYDGDTLADCAEAYCLDVGLTQEEIDTIREIFLTDALTDY